MSTKCATVYCGFVVLFPMVFYFPKFFEYKYQKFQHDFPTPINCTQYILEQRELSEIDKALQLVSYEKGPQLFVLHCVEETSM